MTEIILVILAFFLGSVPTGELIARVKGIDLRRVGSGNIGTTNVLRAAGRLPAVMTLLGDVMKGSVSVLAAFHFGDGPVLAGVVGLASILGHDFSIFLRFRGGKGVATSLGVLLIYAPSVALFTVAVWLVVAAVTKYSSLAALVSFVLLPLSMYLLDPDRNKVMIAVAMTVLLILKHAANIQRLLRGTESKIGEKI